MVAERELERLGRDGVFDHSCRMSSSTFQSSNELSAKSAMPWTTHNVRLQIEMTHRADNA